MTVAPRTPPGVESAPHSLALLADARFRRFWIGQAISELGDGMTSLALIVLVHRLAGTLSAVATLTMLTSLPQIAVGLQAGVFVDRWDRRRTMIACDVARAALVAALVFTQDPLWLPLVLALAVAEAAATVFFEPARTAFIPAIVERPALLSANAFSQSTRVVSMSAGAALAGYLLSLPGGMKLVFALDAVTFVVSAIALSSIRVRARPMPAAQAAPSTPRRSVRGELMEGLALVFHSPTMVGLLVIFAITLLGMSAVTVLFVPFMLRDLGASTLVVGFVRTAQTIGMLAGAALLAGPGSRWSPARVLVWGVAGLGPCLALMGLASHWMALVPVLAAIGLCSSAMQAGTVTLLQRAVPDHARGRAESTFDTLLMGVMLVAMAGAGFFGDRFGARAVFLSAGALAVIAGFVGRSSLGLGRRAVREPWIAEETIIGEPGSR